MLIPLTSCTGWKSIPQRVRATYLMFWWPIAVLKTTSKLSSWKYDNHLFFSRMWKLDLPWRGWHLWCLGLQLEWLEDLSARTAVICWASLSLIWSSLVATRPSSQNEHSTKLGWKQQGFSWPMLGSLTESTTFYSEGSHWERLKCQGRGS